MNSNEHGKGKDRCTAGGGQTRALGPPASPLDEEMALLDLEDVIVRGETAAEGEPDGNPVLLGFRAAELEDHLPAAVP